MKTRRGWFKALLFLVFLSITVTSNPVHAAGPWYVATSGNDTNDCLGPGPTHVCATISGALGKADPYDTIYVALGTYTGVGDEALNINKDVTLSGGWDPTFSSQSGMSIIDGEDTRRGIQVEPLVSAVLMRFIIQNGRYDGGPGIFNEGGLSLYDCIVTSNIDIGDWTSEGGGIRNSNLLVLYNTTVDGNTSSSGAGIFNAWGTVTLNNSTVSGNVASGGGGGINNLGGDLFINSSTISNNVDSDAAGGIHNEAGGTVTLENSLLAGNSGGWGKDCNGNIGSAGYNLIGDTTNCTYSTSTGDLINVDPQIGTLQDNGGPTQTHALLFTSPAINSGNPAGCLDAYGFPLPSDQRGLPRVQNCDIGSFEFQLTNGLPDFAVIMNNELVHGYNWPLGADVTMEIDDPSNGVGVDYTDTQPSIEAPWDPLTTWVEFDLSGSFVVEPGHIVTLTDGVTPKSHTVTELVVISVDPDTDEVVGTATPSTQVNASIDGVYLSSAADPSGDWLIDYTGTHDIVPGDTVYIKQPDLDNDMTRYDWRVPNPQIQADPEPDWIVGWEWPEGETVHVCVDNTAFAADPTDPGQCNLFYGSDTSAIPSWDLETTFVEFDLLSTDLLGGHYIAMTDGVTTKEHQVTDLQVTIVDPDLDTVYGTAAPGSDVLVEPYGCYECRVSVAANGSGDWVADFSGSFDIVAGTEGVAEQEDMDGDETRVEWRMPNPIIDAHPVDDGVWSWDWPIGDTVHVCINSSGFAVDPTDPGQCDLHYDSMTAIEYPWDPGVGRVDFNQNGILDLQSGHYIAMTDGVNTKEHRVTSLTVTDVDPDTDIVSGMAEPGSAVSAWVDDCDGCSVDIVTDGAGNWVADFSGMVDILPGIDGAAQQYDGDGDATTAGWHVYNPIFEVVPLLDEITGTEWPLAAMVDLTIDDDMNPGNGVLYTDSGTVVVSPWDPDDTRVPFNLYGIFDVLPGHVVTMTDGVTTKVHVVTNLEVTDTDPDADTVTGTADPGTDVWVVPEHCWDCGVSLAANGTGDWVADFSGSFDLVLGTDGEATQSDMDGDETGAKWRVPNPQIQADPEPDWIVGWEWPEGETVHVCVDDTDFAADPTDPGQCNLFYGSDTSAIPSWDLETTFVEFDLLSTDLLGGHYIAMTDGVTTKQHQVTDLQVTSVDPDLDTVYGTAAPGSDVELWVNDCDSCWMDVVTDGSGNWVADFSGMVDLEPGMDGGSVQYDSDDDQTDVFWRVPNPQIQANNHEPDWINGWEWPEGETVHVCVDDTSFAADPTDPGQCNLFYGSDTSYIPSWDPGTTFVTFDLSGTDMQVGHYIAMTDGVTTKQHQVTDLEVTSVDPDLDTVYGTAAPGSDVVLWVNDCDSCWMEVTADGSGDWEADFSGMVDLEPGMDGDSEQYDNDGDCTHMFWMIPNHMIFLPLILR